MADSKIEIKIGLITFSGEGSGEWLSKQLDKVLGKIPELIAVAPPENHGSGNNGGLPQPSNLGTQNGKVNGTLAAHLKSLSANKSQPRKFLATAVWLHDTEQKQRLSTTDISGALSKHNQGKLGNASDCLIKNAAKGFCVREGAQFYVSDEGRDSLK